MPNCFAPNDGEYLFLQTTEKGPYLSFYTWVWIGPPRIYFLWHTISMARDSVVLCSYFAVMVKTLNIYKECLIRNGCVNH